MPCPATAPVSHKTHVRDKTRRGQAGPPWVIANVSPSHVQFGRLVPLRTHSATTRFSWLSPIGRRVFALLTNKSIASTWSSKRPSGKPSNSHRRSSKHGAPLSKASWPFSSHSTAGANRPSFFDPLTPTVLNSTLFYQRMPCTNADPLALSSTSTRTGFHLSAVERAKVFKPPKFIRLVITSKTTHFS